MIGRQPRGINEHLLRAGWALAHIKDVQILIGEPLGIEVAPATFERQADHVHLEQFGEPFGDGLLAGELAQGGLGASILRVNPGASFRAGLIFEPAVGIADDRAVDRFLHVVNFGWRRAFGTGSLRFHGIHARNENQKRQK